MFMHRRRRKRMKNVSVWNFVMEELRRKMKNNVYYDKFPEGELRKQLSSMIIGIPEKKMYR